MIEFVGSSIVPSTSDRLRAAANVLDNYGTSWPGDGTTVITEKWLHTMSVAAAALLRAVADEETMYYTSASGIFAAAHTLADAILGKPTKEPEPDPDSVIDGKHCCANWECGMVNRPERKGKHCDCLNARPLDFLNYCERDKT